MKNTIFVTGGCRSGKSAYALEIAAGIDAKKRVFMATCVPHDEEMKQRVARHQAERSSRWETIEVPFLLPEAIKENGKKGALILVDRLTLWTSNLMMETDEDEQIAHHIQRLTLSLEACRCPVILVSNEVGAGIVPDNRLARKFRDMVGWVNQGVAACADRVVWVVAGIPVTIKGS